MKELAQLDALCPGLGGDAGGLIRVGGRVVRPALLRDLVGVDEDAAGKQGARVSSIKGGRGGARRNTKNGTRAAADRFAVAPETLHNTETPPMRGDVSVGGQCQLMPTTSWAMAATRVCAAETTL